jgi:hypothetical protein
MLLVAQIQGCPTPTPRAAAFLHCRQPTSSSACSKLTVLAEEEEETVDGEEEDDTRQGNRCARGDLAGEKDDAART